MSLLGRIGAALRPAPVPRRRDPLAGVPGRKRPPPFRWEQRGPQDWPKQGGEILMSDVPGGPFDLDAPHWYPAAGGEQ